VPPPEGDEVRGRGGAFQMVAGRGPERIVIPASPLYGVDMRRLVARLQERAREASSESLAARSGRAGASITRVLEELEVDQAAAHAMMYLLMITG